MEIKNLQHFIGGEGERSQDVFLTLDLIPIRITLKYDIVETKHYLGDALGEISTRLTPDYIKKIYNMENYQNLVNMICGLMGIDERKVYCLGSGHKIPIFDFNNDEYFYEYQYDGGYGRTYYVKTKLRHAIKGFKQYKKLIHNYTNRQIPSYLDRTTDDKILWQMRLLWDSLIEQKVFLKKDYEEISNTTVNNFLKSLK